MMIFTVISYQLFCNGVLREAGRQGTSDGVVVGRTWVTARIVSVSHHPLFQLRVRSPRVFFPFLSLSPSFSFFLFAPIPLSLARGWCCVIDIIISKRALCGDTFHFLFFLVVFSCWWLVLLHLIDFSLRRVACRGRTTLPWLLFEDVGQGKFPKALAYFVPHRKKKEMIKFHSLTSRLVGFVTGRRHRSGGRWLRRCWRRWRLRHERSGRDLKGQDGSGFLQLFCWWPTEPKCIFKNISPASSVSPRSHSRCSALVTEAQVYGDVSDGSAST